MFLFLFCFFQRTVGRKVWMVRTLPPGGWISRVFFLGISIWVDRLPGSSRVEWRVSFGKRRGPCLSSPHLLSTPPRCSSNSPELTVCCLMYHVFICLCTSKHGSSPSKRYGRLDHGHSRADGEYVSREVKDPGEQILVPGVPHLNTPPWQERPFAICPYVHLPITASHRQRSCELQAPPCPAECGLFYVHLHVALLAWPDFLPQLASFVSHSKWCHAWPFL